jgi:hypothetical protein
LRSPKGTSTTSTAGRDGVVFIAEDREPDEHAPGAWWFNARFDAHWESEDGRECREGPAGVSAQEAIEWGRRQADVVQIRVGDGDLGGADHGYFSAGVTQPDGDRLPVWPPAGLEITRRRVR